VKKLYEYIKVIN